MCLAHSQKVQFWYFFVFIVTKEILEWMNIERVQVVKASLELIGNVIVKV